MSLRILHIYQKFSFTPSGGVEQAIKQYSFALHKYYQCQNTVLYLDSHPSVKKKDYLKAISTKQIGKIASCAIPNLSFFRKFKALQKDHEIILFHYPFPIQDLILVFGLINKPYYIYYHSDIIKQKRLLKIYKPFRYLFFKFAKHIITSSENYLNSSIFLKKYKDKSTAIPLILNKEFLKVKKKKILFKFFLFIGQHRHYKNIENIIKAFQQLPNHKLIIIGIKKRQIINIEIPSNILLIDHVIDEEKYQYIQQCEAILLPSTNRAEAFGYTLLEGLLFKRPLISSQIKSGTTFINKHLKTGYVIKKYPTDKEIVKSIKFINNNNRLFKNSKNYDEQISHFRPEIISQKIIKLFKHRNISRETIFTK
tara:strand:+ start:355 stop:1455 length:1101 start_codon:yes stop_codon:yes gene_type:complete